MTEIKTANASSQSNSPKSTGFMIFGNGTVQIHELLIRSLKLKSSLNEDLKKKVKITRTHKTSTGFQQEDSKMDFQIDEELEAFHLHDIFLTESFGLTVQLLDSDAQFEFTSQNSSQSASANPLVSLLSLEGAKIHPSLYVRGTSL